MTGRGESVARRWAAVALAAAVCGRLSALAPVAATAPATASATAPARTVRDTVAAGRPESPGPTPVPEPRPADCGTVKCVALTFDDGPVSDTARLLDMLADLRVKATFFVIGRNVAERPGLVRRQAAAGHELANHTYTHADLGESSEARVTSELARTQRAIERAAGVTPVLMRPPFGSTDERVASVAERLGLAQVLWALDPLDWRNRDSERVERKVVEGTRNGDIVLMHDIHSTTVDAVPRIIERLRAEGYAFVTVSQLYGEPLTPGRKYTERTPDPPEPDHPDADHPEPDHPSRIEPGRF